VGEVTGVEVDRRRKRPVKITIYGHAHSYQVAWRNTDDGPIITDLAVSSDEQRAITTDDLKRINAKTLALAARRYDTDSAAELGQTIGALMEADAALADAMSQRSPADRVAGYLTWLEGSGDEFCADLAADMRQAAKAPDLSDLADQIDAAWQKRGGSFVILDRVIDGAVAIEMEKRGVAPRKGRGGRPPLTREFLEQVAEWAREAKDLNIRNPANYILERAIPVRGYEVSPAMVKKWIRRCKDDGLLADDALRRPKLAGED